MKTKKHFLTKTIKIVILVIFSCLLFLGFFSYFLLRVFTGPRSVTVTKNQANSTDGNYTILLKIIDYGGTYSDCPNSNWLFHDCGGMHLNAFLKNNIIGTEKEILLPPNFPCFIQLGPTFEDVCGGKSLEPFTIKGNQFEWYGQKYSL